MALQDTIILYKSEGDCYKGGVLVPRNAGQLAAKLDQGVASWSLETYLDEYAASPFAESDVVWIGKEKILVGSGTGITRGHGGTTDADHNKGSVILPDAGGEAILNKTVPAGDAGKTITGFRAGGNAPAQFEILVNGALVGMPISTLYHQEVFFPWSGGVLTENDTLVIRVFNWYPESVFWAQVVI